VIDMSREYYQFGRKHFEFEVRNFLIKNRLGFLKDITQQYIEEGNETWENIYTISTGNKSVEILVYSSIDIRTGYVREHGDDAVRMVLRWKTRNGYVYKKLGKHLRIKTLFNNMEKTVKSVRPTIFNLKYNEFSKGEC